jgi:hypothetical protein
MQTAAETKQLMMADPQWWKIPLMDFVDDFRRNRDLLAISEPFEFNDEEKDAVFAGVIETLCDELGLDVPIWLAEVPTPRHPVFLSRMENLKAIAIVESPVRMRLRKVFVMENFLHRV